MFFEIRTVHRCTMVSWYHFAVEARVNGRRIYRLTKEAIEFPTPACLLARLMTKLVAYRVTNKKAGVTARWRGSRRRSNPARRQSCVTFRVCFDRRTSVSVDCFKENGQSPRRSYFLHRRLPVTTYFRRLFVL